ncbi:putative inner dynein arm light chain, axonemal [Bradysia coprophila]|uniref:putative inner dynein arm light chain, axonemal n=1 Tax=Bradysia coprophila TaxID=38358 RepID=UPI00187DAB42|nr:putative inner dynein arm light chain, axonemal [Bradysia coprophila]
MAECMDYSDEQIDETTLVKYNNPVLVIKNPEKQLDTVANLKIQKQEREGRPNSGGITADNRKETEEILNDILPPRCWEEEGQLWSQTVSSVPATRQDVSNLQEMLDTRLQQTQARETGICPVRRELYRQCFDEIIRQVTINCAERGFLLSRIRDEIAMSMEAYETLYCSSAAFGIRKALQSQEGKEQLYQKVLDLQIECDAMRNEIKDMEHKAEQTERRNNEMKLSEERKHAEEVAFLKKTNAQLKSQLEGIIAPKK